MRDCQSDGQIVSKLPMICKPLKKLITRQMRWVIGGPHVLGTRKM